MSGHSAIFCSLRCWRIFCDRLTLLGGSNISIQVWDVYVLDKPKPFPILISKIRVPSKISYATIDLRSASEIEVNELIDESYRRDRLKLSSSTYEEMLYYFSDSITMLEFQRTQH